MNLGVLKYIKTLDKYGFANGEKTRKYHPIICLDAENVFDSYWDYFVVNGRLFLIALMGSDNILNGANLELIYINPNSIVSVYIPKELKADVDNVTSETSADFIKDIKNLLKDTIEGKENFSIPYSSMKIYISGQILFGNSSYKQKGDLFQLDNELINIAKVVEYDNKTGQAFETRRFIGTFDKVDAVSIPFAHLPQTPFKDLVGDEIKQLCANYLSSKDMLNGVRWIKPTTSGYRQGERVWIYDPKTKTKKFYVSKEYENNINPLEDTNQEHWIQIKYS